ncbi:MAG: hypothetical protein WDA16_12640 [Candidatus Thermoplasmatota archaeon]
MSDPQRHASATATLDYLGFLNDRESLEVDDIAWAPHALMKNDPSAAEMIRYFELDRLVPRGDEAEN